MKSTRSRIAERAFQLGRRFAAIALVATTAGLPTVARANDPFDTILYPRHELELPRSLLAVRSAPRPADRLPSLDSIRYLDDAPQSESPWKLRKWLPLLLMLGATVAVREGFDSPDSPRWTDRNRFDDSARNSFRASSEGGRQTAADVSTAFLATNAALLVGDWVLERKTYSIPDSLRIDAAWLLGSGVLTTSIKLAAARERPYVPGCEAGIITSGCGSSDRYESFYSGHASLSATLAGLICARRLHKPQRGQLDYWTCGGASSLALATGFLRLAADEHWMSDVLVGWSTGLVFGYLLPSYFNYGLRASSRPDGSPAPSHFVSPIVGTQTWGLRYDVTF